MALICRLFQLDSDCGYGGSVASTNPLLLLRGGERPGVERDRWSPLATRVPLGLGSLVSAGHSQATKRRRSSQGPLPPFEEEPLMAPVGNLERENRMLRERVEDLQKQVSQLSRVCASVTAIKQYLRWLVSISKKNQISNTFL